MATKENLMKSPSLDENGGHDGNVSSHGTAGECGGTVDAEDVENNSQVEGFLYIPVSRLIFLSMLTFGLYCYYWQYRNWGYVKEREGLSISPFWRAWFWLFCVCAFESNQKRPLLSSGRPTLFFTSAPCNRCNFFGVHFAVD